MIELEAKVRLSILQKEEVLKKLQSFAKFIGEKKKEDSYFSLKNKEKVFDYPLFRIRKENGKNIITQKKHKIKDGIETNEEIEFEVSDFNSFFNFSESLGYKNSFSKIKNSLFFTFGNFNLELCETPPLGWFLEIEILTEKNKVKENTVKLIDIFSKFGFNEQDFERKKYLELLNNYPVQPHHFIKPSKK